MAQSMLNELTEERIRRYSRHIILPELGGKGQKKLLASSVLIVGAGGLGSPAALYLAAAGVGRIGIVDGDRVELSNLHRQIIHFTKDIGKPKTLSACEKITTLNPDVKVETYDLRIDEKNIMDIIDGYDVIAEGSDNIPTKLLVNDASILSGKPLVIAAVVRLFGHVMTVLPGRSACYRCLIPSPPPEGAVPTCQEAGILGPVAGIAGLIQAAEVIKVILSIGDFLIDRILFIDAFYLSFSEIKIKRNSSCPVCGPHASIRKPIRTAGEMLCASGN